MVYCSPLTCSMHEWFVLNKCAIRGACVDVRCIQVHIVHIKTMSSTINDTVLVECSGQHSTNFGPFTQAISQCSTYCLLYEGTARTRKKKKKRNQQRGNERKLWVQEKVKTVGSRPWQYHFNRATELSRMCKWKKNIKQRKHNPPVLLGSTQMRLQNPAVIIHKWKKETTYSERFVFIIWGLLFLFSNIFLINCICTCHIPLFASEMFSSSLLPLEYKPHPLKSSSVSSSSSETCALLVVVAFN